MEPVKILVVDDQPPNLLLLETALRTKTCIPIKANSGAEAVKLYQEHEFALVILDVQMPRMNGFETATKMRELKRPQHPPIIFVTAIHVDEEYIFRGYETGAVDYIAKPIKLNILRSKVNVFVELHQQRLSLEEANQQLQTMNEDLTKTNQDLQLARSQLIQSAKMALLGELETSVIHELNQPLFGISLYAENLLTHLEKGNYHKLQPGLENILNQVQRASVIIEHLRAFGRDTSNLEHEPADINKIIQDSLFLTNEQMKVNEIEVVTDLSGSLPQVVCNAIQIEQVISNLLMNAKEAVKNEEHKQISLKSHQLKEWVVIEIEDTGEGIPEENLEKIFNPFFTTKTEGMGLGLSISHNIVNSHGGHLIAESTLNKGSLFKIELPVVE